MQQKEFSSVGKSVRKKDSMSLLLGKPVYTDDITQGDFLTVKVLRSPHAHAWIEEIDPLHLKFRVLKLCLHTRMCRRTDMR